MAIINGGLFPSLIIIFFYSAAVNAKWENLRVKYALWDGFYKIPQTVDDAAPEYVKMSHDENLNVDLYSYPDDPRVSILFDSHGNIAGLRTAYIKEDVAKRAESKGMKRYFSLYSYDDKPMYTSGNYWNTPLWYTSVLFMSPEKLKAGGRSDRKGLVAEDIYLKLDGNWTLIPKDECKVENLGFTEQGCFLGMGKHYFYKVTPTSECDDYQGAFLLYESGELIGLGINPFGSFTSKDRVWFEDVPAKIVKILTIPSSYIFEVLRNVRDNLEWFSQEKTHHRHNTRNHNLLVYPHHTTTALEKGIYYMGLKLYNKLPYEMKEASLSKMQFTEKSIVAGGPECLESYVENFGVTSLHMFFKNSPRLTFCTWPWQKSDHCKKD